MNFLSRLAVRRPIACCMLAVTIVVCGLLSWRQLELGMFPDLRQPTLMVVVNAGQRSGPEMERRFGELLERQVFAIRGLTTVSQTATTGRLVARLGFQWSSDMALALVDVNRALAALAASPDIDSVVVRHFDPQQQPVMVVGLTAKSASIAPLALRQLAQRRLARTLEQQPGVAEVYVAGGQLPEVAIELDPQKLGAYGLTIAEVVQRIRAANMDVYAGSLQQNDKLLMIKALSRYARLDDIRGVVVRYVNRQGQADVVPVTIGDIGQVRLGSQPVRGLVRVNGQDGIGLFVYKDGGANTVNVARVVREAITQIQQDYPDIKLTVLSDDARVIEASVADVESAIVYGILLATLVVVLFLRSPAPVVIVAVSIPVSLLATIIVMNIAGQSLNLMTLGGLALGAGMLIDNSIVVIDSIYRYRRQGCPMSESAARGAAAVSGAIFSSTLTSCAIFLPVFFIDGIAARLLSGLALTVVVTLLASLLVAVLLIPALAKLLLSDIPPTDIDPGNSRFEQRIWLLLGRARWVLSGTVVLVIVSVAALYLSGTTLVPPQDPRQLTLKLTTTPGQSAAGTAAVTSVVEQLIRQSAGGHPPQILAEIGQLDTQQHDSGAIQRQEHQTQLLIRLTAEHPPAAVLMDRVNQGLAALFGTESEWLTQGSVLADAMGTQEEGLRIEVAGNSYLSIRQLSELVQHRLKQISGLQQVRTSFDGAAPVLTLKLNATAAAYGVDLTQLAQVLSVALDGEPVTTMADGDELHPIRVSVASSGWSVAQLYSIRFRSNNGYDLTVGDIAQVVAEPGVHTIYRRDQRRMAEVFAQFESGAARSEVRRQVQQALAGLQLPAGSLVRLTGPDQQQAQMVGDFAWVAVLAVALVFMVLAATFESLLLPVIIIAAVPVGLIGVAIFLLPLAEPIGAMALLGIVVLTGIVVNDAILLVQKADELLRSGVPLRRALAQAAAKRLRPILMTSVTTIVALLPMAVGDSEAAAVRAPLALTLIGGLLTATIGSLTVTPCLYLVLARRHARYQQAEVAVFTENVPQQKVS